MLGAHPPPGPRVKPQAHWRVLGSLLYARTPAVSRVAQGVCQVDTAGFARVVGIRPARLKAYLTQLQVVGLVSGLRWYRGSFSCVVTPPVGSAWVTGGSIDV